MSNVGGTRKLAKNEILFREGEASEAMYVIKTGRIAITKAKGQGDIILAELGPGEMFGEMAFFDSKPRSAGAKALGDAEVIILPFKALHAQFKTFPEWLKAMVKTVNSHLREANTRIKNLENATKGDDEMFPPHMITRLCGVIALIGFKAGEETPEGMLLPTNMLRNYTIQIFQLPTNKLDRLMEVLQGLGIMKVEDLGEGRRKILLLKHKLLADFVDFYNKYLFTDEAKRVTIEEKEMNVLKAIIFYGKKVQPDAKGMVTISLTEMQNSSMKDLGYLVGVNDPDPFTEKGLIGEKQSADGGVLKVSFKMEDVETILPYWEIIHCLKKVPGRG